MAGLIAFTVYMSVVTGLWLFANHMAKRERAIRQSQTRELPRIYKQADDVENVTLHELVTAAEDSVVKESEPPKAFERRRRYSDEEFDYNYAWRAERKRRMQEMARRQRLHDRGFWLPDERR